MPRGDGTGPMGMGPMTGRGAGYCAGVATPGGANPAGFAGGFGCGAGGFGRGRGFRRMFYATGLPRWGRNAYAANPGMYEPDVSEKELLSNEAEFLENQLQQVKKRLSSLKGDTE